MLLLPELQFRLQTYFFEDLGVERVAVIDTAADQGMNNGGEDR